MTKNTATEKGGDAGLVEAGERWVKSFTALSLEPADASDLVESAQKVAQAVARAARGLTWQTPDSFIAAMRQAEQSSDC